MSIKIDGSQIVIVGYGRVGTSLYKVLKNYFKNINIIHSYQIEFFEKRKIFKNLIVFLTIKDDFLRNISEKISLLDFKVIDGIAFHTCGALSHNIISPLKEKNFKIASFHPLFTFREKNLPEEIWKDMVIAIEGDKEAVEIAFLIAKKIKGLPFKIKGREKELYHAVASLLSQSGYFIYEIVEKTVEGTDFGKIKEVKDSLYSLLINSLNNSRMKGKEYATGPAIRKDLKTIERHLKILEKNPTTKNFYQLLTDFIINEDS